MVSAKHKNSGDAPDQVTLVGRLEELNGHGALTGRLWEADGTRWLCQFNPEHAAILSTAWMRTVRVVGRASGNRGERALVVDSVAPVNGDVELTATPQSVSFWTSLSLAELAARQGVKPVTNLDEIGDLWPEDDDPDELIRFLMEERAARRHMAEDGDVL